MITAGHLTGVESSRTRMTCIKFEKGDVDNDTLHYYQNRPLILPTYLAHFLAFVSQHVPELITYINEKISEYRNKIRFKIARYNDIAAQFMVAVDVMFNFWQKSGFLNHIKEDPVFWKNNLLEIIAKNDKQLEQIDVANVILQALVEEMQGNPRNVKHVDLITSSDGEKIYYDDEIIYCSQNALYLLTKEFCKRYDIPFYQQPNMIFGKLREKDILACRENSKGHVESSRKLKQGKGDAEKYRGGGEGGNFQKGYSSVMTDMR